MRKKYGFLINMSHELRTPLMLIYAPLRRLLSKDMTVDGKLKEQLEGICKQVRRMKNLIEMVLDVRRIEMGQNVLHLSTTHFNDWLEDIAGSFTEEFTNKGVDFIYNFDNQIADWTFDMNKCEMIISNLLANALKFTPAGSTVTLTTRQRRRAYTNSDNRRGCRLGRRGYETSVCPFLPRKKFERRKWHRTILCESVSRAARRKNKCL